MSDLFTGAIHSAFGDGFEITRDNSNHKSKDYLDVIFLEPHGVKPLFTSGFAACSINNDILIKRHISGTFYISHRHDFLTPGGYVFDWHKAIDNIRCVDREEMPERALSIEFPIGDKAPFWFKKHGLVDINVMGDDGNVMETKEVGGFCTIEFRMGSTTFKYPVVPMIVIDMLYRLKNLKPDEEEFILGLMMQLDAKQKQRTQFRPGADLGGWKNPTGTNTDWNY